MIGGNAIEFVSSWPHLDHILITDMNDKTDIEDMKHSLCGQMNDVSYYVILVKGSLLSNSS